MQKRQLKNSIYKVSMKYKLNIIPRTLHFKQPAGTSRGIYTTRKSWIIEATSDDKPGIKGMGECAPLPDLSCDARPEYEATLEQLCRMTELTGTLNHNMLRPYPSILFGLETALLDLENGGKVFCMIPLSHVEKRVFASTDWFGWATMTRCCNVLKTR